MRRTSVYLNTAFALLLSPALFLAQRQAPAGAPAAGGPPRGARQRGPAPPANVASHNTGNDARHQSFVDIAKKGHIDPLFVGDSITARFYWPLRGGHPTAGRASPA